MKKLYLMLMAIILILSTSCSDSSLQNSEKELEAAETYAQTSGNGAGESKATGKDIYLEEVLFTSIPVYSLMGLKIYEVNDSAWGDILEYEDGSYCGHVQYENIILYHNWYSDITSICINASAGVVDGVTLDKNRNDLVEIFGLPDCEEWGHSDYFIQYNQDCFVYEFIMSSPDETAHSIYIGYQDDLWFDDTEYATEGYESIFRRSDYFTGISRVDLLRYPDSYYYSKVYFIQFVVTQIYEPKLYLVKYNSKSNSEYLIIDDRGNNGVNAIVGDVISVYGVFHRNETINWTNGGSEQVPLIAADLLIVNNIAPDADEFAKAVVETLNAYSLSYGFENEYISGQYVNLICLVSTQNNVPNVIWPCDFKETYKGPKLYVDGYYIYALNAKYDGKSIGGKSGGLERFPIEVSSDSLYCMSGYVSFKSDSLLGINYIEFDIEGIEPYE